jgi:hypothetical protein
MTFKRIDPFKRLPDNGDNVWTLMQNGLLVMANYDSLNRVFRTREDGKFQSYELDEVNSWFEIDVHYPAIRPAPPKSFSEIDNHNGRIQAEKQRDEARAELEKANSRLVKATEAEEARFKMFRDLQELDADLHNLFMRVKWLPKPNSYDEAVEQRDLIKNETFILRNVLRSILTDNGLANDYAPSYADEHNMKIGIDHTQKSKDSRGKSPVLEFAKAKNEVEEEDFVLNLCLILHQFELKGRSRPVSWEIPKYILEGFYKERELYATAKDKDGKYENPYPFIPKS